MVAHAVQSPRLILAKFLLTCRKNRFKHLLSDIEDQRVESLVRALLSSFESWGGIPLVAVFDNPKTVVLGRYRYFIYHLDP